MNSEHILVVMESGPKISGWSSTEVTELKTGAERQEPEGQRRGKEAVEHYAHRTITGGYSHIQKEH